MLDNIWILTTILERAWPHHAVCRAQSEARVFQVNIIIHTRKHISIQTLIKIRTKVSGWETTNVRTLEEARALARWEAKGLGASACMAALTNPGGDDIDMGRVHQAFLV